MFDCEPRRRDHAFVVSSHELTDLKRFASVWTDGVKVGAMVFEKTDQQLTPVSEWQSSQTAMNFDFAKVLKDWHAAAPIERAIVNGLEGIEAEKHPVKRLLITWLHVDVVEAVLPFEGLASYQETISSGRLDLAGYPGGSRIEERLRRLSGPPEPLLMAFFQGLAREPRFYSYSSKRVRIGGRHRLAHLFP